MFFLKSSNSSVVLIFALLSIAFSSYDLILLFFGKAQTLLNEQVQDGYCFDEAYTYLAGIGKKILFNSYLKEHATDLTLLLVYVGNVKVMLEA